MITKPLGVVFPSMTGTEPPLTVDPALGVVNTFTTYVSIDNGVRDTGGSALSMILSQANGGAGLYSGTPPVTIHFAQDLDERRLNNAVDRMIADLSECLRAIEDPVRRESENRSNQPDMEFRDWLFGKLQSVYQEARSHPFGWDVCNAEEGPLLRKENRVWEIAECIILKGHPLYLQPVLLPKNPLKISPKGPPSLSPEVLNLNKPLPIRIGNQEFWDPNQRVRETLLAIIRQRLGVLPDGFALYVACCHQLSHKGWPQNTLPVTRSAASKLCDREPLFHGAYKKDRLWQAILAGQIFGFVSFKQVAASFVWGNQLPLAVLTAYAAMSASLLIPGYPTEVRAVLGAASVVSAFLVHDPLKKWWELGDQHIVFFAVILSFILSIVEFEPFSLLVVPLLMGLIILLYHSTLPYFQRGSRKARGLWSEWTRPGRWRRHWMKEGRGRVRRLPSKSPE